MSASVDSLIVAVVAFLLVVTALIALGWTPASAFVARRRQPRAEPTANLQGLAVSAARVALVAVIAGVAAVAALFVLVTVVDRTPEEEPAIPQAVHLTVVQRSVYDPAARSIELHVAYEPTDVTMPVVACTADDGAGTRLLSTNSATIIGRGQVAKHIEAADAPAGEYRIRCRSGDSEAEALASVPAAAMPP